MNTAPQNVLAIYDVQTKQLIRYVIPDFDEQTNDQSHWSAQKGEAALKIPMSVYQTFGRYQAVHLDVQLHVYNHS